MLEMHLVVDFIYILIPALLGSKKEYNIALVYGVVAPCYHYHKQGATTPMQNLC